MTTITINRFDGGISDDYQHGGAGEFSISKHFDILTYPRRLQPVRGMTAGAADIADITLSKIGNIIVTSNGLMYGVGCDSPGNPTLGELWYKPGYGASDTWRSVPTNAQLAGVVPKYNFLVEYQNAASSTRKIFWAGAGKLIQSDPNGSNSADTSNTLSFTNIGQGFVHPKDKILYVPYDNKIGTINGASSDTINTAVWTLPSQYMIPCLSNYGNYLAIPAYVNSGSGTYSSVVYLSDRDTSISTFNESIPWGEGQLKIINNLNGSLIGISSSSANYNGSVQDYDSIFIKVYEGGTEPILIKEIKAQRVTTTAPSVTINPRVNFIYKNRLYFSINVVNGGTAPAYYGLWSVGKSKLTGRYTVTMERVATNANTETGVIAAAISGDFVAMVHTAEGSVVETENGNTLSAIYDATSVYESTINPEMPENEKGDLKQLEAVYCNYLPLPTDAVVTMQYRVDVLNNASGSTLGTGWTTIFTETGDGVVSTERIKDAAGAEFSKGINYEFRLTSTDGAVITEWGYKYKVLPTNI